MDCNRIAVWVNEGEGQPEGTRCGSTRNLDGELKSHLGEALDLCIEALENEETKSTHAR